MQLPTVSAATPELNVLIDAGDGHLIFGASPKTAYGKAPPISGNAKRYII